MHSTYVYQPYPRRLYLGGDVLAADVVVDDAEGEAKARAEGYCKAWESIEKAEPEVVSTDPDIDALRKEAEAKGIKVDGRWKEARLRDEIAKCQQ